MTFEQIDVALARTARAAAQAREALRQLNPLLSPDTFEDLRLLVSEVVANSVRHAGSLGAKSFVRLKVFATEKLVRVEVTDEGPGFDKTALRTPGSDDASGRGLFLVDQIAQSWGVHKDGETCVWFVLVA
ncbi:MAG TPA: ATP-binding protein [Actinomycetota bacterium]|jgi:anti-sigma regulatory factor (Ser/Thr protein kinase)